MENTREEIECFQIEKLMDDTPIIETLVENLSLDIKVNKVHEKNGERFISNLQKLHAQRLFCKLERRNAICWAFYVLIINQWMVKFPKL
jgi:hypothetical protein